MKNLLKLAIRDSPNVVIVTVIIVVIYIYIYYFPFFCKLTLFYVHVCYSLQQSFPFREVLYPLSFTKFHSGQLHQYCANSTLTMATDKSVSRILLYQYIYYGLSANRTVRAPPPPLPHLNNKKNTSTLDSRLLFA